MTNTSYYLFKWDRRYYARSIYCNAKSAVSRGAPNFISLENEALRKNIKTSIFCTQRKYLEFPVRKCSIYQLEDTTEKEGCGRFCYHTHFLTKIQVKYFALTLIPYFDDGFLWNAN